MKNFTDFSENIYKDADKDEEGNQGQHIVMQLRKSVSLNGNKDVKFNDGKSHKVTRQHAQKFLQKHQKMHRADDKRKLQNHAAKSHDHFQGSIKETKTYINTIASAMSRLIHKN
jgi:hypothetical protein|tara:strand:- start:805 stop:1146 length:342 start_codon:yes stop_codon:yes gene_type:complete